MAFFVLDSIRFLKAGHFEFKPMEREEAAKWIGKIPSWKWQIGTDRDGDRDYTTDNIIQELSGMINRPLNPTDRLPRHQLVELGKDDQALLIYAKPIPADSAASDNAGHIVPGFLYGVLRGE